MKWSKRLAEIERLKRKHGSDRSLVRSFPDLKVAQKSGVAPCGNGFGKTTGVREMPADAKHYPVGHLHKQGTVLITPGAIETDLEWYGGKKS